MTIYRMLDIHSISNSISHSNSVSNSKNDTDNDTNVNIKINRDLESWLTDENLFADAVFPDKIFYISNNVFSNV